MKDRNLPDRPVRSELEPFFDKIPDGPLGVLGSGNVYGGATYLTASALQGLNPVDGVRIGYNFESSSVTRRNGQEMHTYRVNASSRQVAQFAARYKASPSNIDYLTDRPTVTGTSLVKERNTLPLWEVTVLVGDETTDTSTQQTDTDADPETMT